MTPSTHASLLECLRDPQQQEQGWTRFVNLYRPVLVQWGVHRGLQAEDAEDLAQDLLIKLQRVLPEHEHDPRRGQFRSWLAEMVRNALIDLHRRNARRPGDRAGGGDYLAGVLSQIEGPETIADLDDRMLQVNDPDLSLALDRVKKRVNALTWRIFEERVLHGRPAKEVAVDTKKNVASIHQAVFRISEMLAEEYRKALSA